MKIDSVRCTQRQATWRVRLAACLALIAAPIVVAQAPGQPAQELSAAQLEELVGPIALYPDDLVAIILPASTNPLQLVQADRFLEKRKKSGRVFEKDLGSNTASIAVHLAAFGPGAGWMEVAAR
jgi:hypothetical protein